MPPHELPLLADRSAAPMNDEAAAAALDTSDATKRAADAGVPEGTEVTDHAPDREQQSAEDPECQPSKVEQPAAEPVSSNDEWRVEQPPAFDKDQAAVNNPQPDDEAPPQEKERDDQQLKEHEPDTDRVTDRETVAGEPEPREQVARAAGETALKGEDHETTEFAPPSEAGSEDEQQPEVVDHTPTAYIEEDNDNPSGNDTEEADPPTSAEAPDTRRLQVTDGGGGDDRGPKETAAEGDDGPEYLSYKQYLERSRPYIDIAPNGTIRLLDSKTGNPLDEGTIPRILQEDPSLQRGYEFLTRNGEAVDARLLLSRHTKDTDLADAGIDLNAEARRLAEQRGVLFVEGIFPNDDEKTKRLNEFDQRSHLIYPKIVQIKRELRALKTDDYSFDAEIAVQLAGTGVQVEFPDFVQQSNSPVDQELAKLIGLYWAHLIPPEDEQEKIQAHHAFIAIDAVAARYRDQYWVGKIGSELSTFPRLDRQKPLYSGVLIGAGHSSIGDHLNKLGVQRLSYKGLRMEEYPGLAHTSNIFQGARSGIFTRDQLEKIRHAS